MRPGQRSLDQGWSRPLPRSSHAALQFRPERLPATAHSLEVTAPAGAISPREAVHEGPRLGALISPSAPSERTPRTAPSLA
jgi:hypothetical protein